MLGSALEADRAAITRRLAGADAEQVSASSKDGVVELTLPKAEKKEEPKRIRVV